MLTKNSILNKFSFVFSEDNFTLVDCQFVSYNIEILFKLGDIQKKYTRATFFNAKNLENFSVSIKDLSNTIFSIPNPKVTLKIHWLLYIILYIILFARKHKF